MRPLYWTSAWVKGCSSTIRRSFSATSRASFALDLREHDHELLAAVADQGVHPADVRAQQQRELVQRVVARAVPARRRSGA